MADLATEKGFTIQSFAEDPKASEALAATWASGGNLNLARQGLRGAGTLTAGIVAGGAGVPGKHDETETYNGTSWTEVADLNTARAEGGMASAGPSTANLYFSGQGVNPSPPPGNITLTSTESWNGSSWTEVAATGLTLGTANIGTGTQTAALCCGGYVSGASTAVGSFNGTSWAAATAMNTGRFQLGGCGTSTASIVFGNEPASAVTETFDGSTWTAVNSLNNARNQAAGFGTTTSAIAVGNLEPPTGVDQQTEHYDGTTWTTVADLATGRWMGGAAGTGTSGFLAGGAIPAQTNVTEEFAVPSTASVAQPGQVWFNTDSVVLKGFKKSFGTGAWASGTNMTTAKAFSASGGTQTAGLVFGGAPGDTGDTETYNGSAWTEVSNMNTSRLYGMGFGTQTAALSAGGEPGAKSECETYNGTSWTEVNNINTARAKAQSFGTTTAGILAGGGTDPTPMTFTESWDGTCWTEVNNMNTTQSGGGGVGVQSDGIIAGGQHPPTTSVELWDGTSWTEVNDINSARYQIVGSGVASTGALIYGGQDPYSALTEEYDGTSWNEKADLATARSGGGLTFNSTTSTLCAGGTTGPYLTTTEEWTVPSPNEIKTFTAS